MAGPKAGYNRQVFIGTAGVIADQQLLHVQNASLDATAERWETSDRGDSIAIPHKNEQSVMIAAVSALDIIYFDGDANVATLIAAAQSQSILSLLVIRFATGPTEFDGDVYVDYTSPGNLKDGMILNFTVAPTNELRDWSFT